MSEAYLGEIRMFAGNFAPQGWALCNGQLLSIAENEALYSLLGTTYGGNGQTTFALPDLQGRLPIHVNTTYPLGAKGGTENVTITLNQLPSHNHTVNASSTGTSTSAQNLVWSNASKNIFASSGTTINMNANSITVVGGNLPHNNLMPSTTLSFIISLWGTYPPQPY